MAFISLRFSTYCTALMLLKFYVLSLITEDKFM